MSKQSAFVEYRPLSDDQNAGVTHHVVIVDSTIVKTTATQRDAEEWACKQGYAVHVARERHRQHKPTPAHWRTSDCKAA